MASFNRPPMSSGDWRAAPRTLVNEVATAPRFAHPCSLYLVVGTDGDTLMRARSLILVLVMQPVVTTSLAQDASKVVDTNRSVRRPVPEEHKAFVTEFENILR